MLPPIRSLQFLCASPWIYTSHRRQPKIPRPLKSTTCRHPNFQATSPKNSLSEHSNRFIWPIRNPFHVSPINLSNPFISLQRFNLPRNPSLNLNTSCPSTITGTLEKSPSSNSSRPPSLNPSTNRPCTFFNPRYLIHHSPSSSPPHLLHNELIHKCIHLSIWN